MTHHISQNRCIMIMRYPELLRDIHPWPGVTSELSLQTQVSILSSLNELTLSLTPGNTAVWGKSSTWDHVWGWCLFHLRMCEQPVKRSRGRVCVCGRRIQSLTLLVSENTMDHRAFDLSENNSPLLRPPFPPFIACQDLDSFTSTEATAFCFVFSCQHAAFPFRPRQLLRTRVSGSLPLCFLWTNNSSITKPDRSSIRLTGSISIYGKLIKQGGASSLPCNHLSGSVLLIQLHLSTVVPPLLNQWISAAILKHFRKVNYCSTTAQPQQWGENTLLHFLTWIPALFMSDWNY